jgi:hypothetical protein
MAGSFFFEMTVVKENIIEKFYGFALNRRVNPSVPLPHLAVNGGGCCFIPCIQTFIFIFIHPNEPVGRNF